MTTFDDYRVLSFDCYGTLIDWETGLLQSLQPWTAWHDIDLTGDELLALFAQHEATFLAQNPTTLYSDALAEVLRRVATSLGCEVTEEECASFGNSVPAWPAFADTARALRALKERYRLVIVSNIDRASFAGSNRRLGVEFDLVVTAEDVGSYKPSTGHFDALFAGVTAMGFERGQLLHVAQSLFHDIGPTQRLGVDSAWIDRRHERPGGGATPPTDVEPSVRYTSMRAFAADALQG
ncbi:MAG: putative 2-haloacid dehalogenase [Ilumatobacteraceae bacterium]|nr:putative 2-haloacid dehalogenase [Ilumatobacteraceae bacterium]